MLIKFLTWQSRSHKQFVCTIDWTLVQTGANCPQPGSYMVEIFSASVHTEIWHKALSRGQFVCTGMYYHRTTFLQLNTIRFLLPFPHPFIPSELSGFGRNESMYMSQFLFEDILPITRCNNMQKVLDQGGSTNKILYQGLSKCVND